MDDIFTDDELKMIARIEASSKWDDLRYHLSFLVPSIITIGAGIYLLSPVVIVSGVIVYSIILIWGLINQVQMHGVLRSIIMKKKKEITAKKSNPAET